MPKKRKMKLLIVDNDVDLMETLVDYLKRCDFDVTGSSSSLDALKLIRSQDFDLVITDIVMPDISGLGIISIVKNEIGHVPVIAMTGYGEKVEKLTKERKPDYYLEKPFSMEQLVKIINYLLKDIVS